MGIERRKDRRYPYGIKVVLTSGRQECVAQTDDVSFKGVFVRTDVPLPERHLVRLRFTLPPDDGELVLTGMVARCIRPTGGGAPGAGIQFYGASQADLDRWNKFIRFVAHEAAPKAKSAVVPSASVRRRYPRYGAALKVHLRTVDDLHTLFTKNVSKGGIFVTTSLDLAPGTEVRVSVVHPQTGDRFALDAVVRWRAQAPEPGLGIEFTSLDDRRREEFFAFISSEVLGPTEDITYVPADDPHLVASGPREPGDPAPEDDIAVEEST